MKIKTKKSGKQQATSEDKDKREQQEKIQKWCDKN